MISSLCQRFFGHSSEKFLLGSIYKKISNRVLLERLTSDSSKRCLPSMCCYLRLVPLVESSWTTPSDGPETARNCSIRSIGTNHRHQHPPRTQSDWCPEICLRVFLSAIMYAILIASFLPLLLSAISPDLISDWALNCLIWFKWWISFLLTSHASQRGSSVVKHLREEHFPINRS